SDNHSPDKSRANSLANHEKRGLNSARKRTFGRSRPMNKITILLAAAVTLFAGCTRGIKGDGVIKTENRSILGFSKVEVTGAFKINWSSGKPALDISADQNLLPLIETVVNGDTLRIESKENLSPTKDITIILSSAF